MEPLSILLLLMMMIVKMISYLWKLGKPSLKTAKNQLKKSRKDNNKRKQKKTKRKNTEKSEIKKASSIRAYRQDVWAIIWNAILAVSWRCVSGTRVAGSGGVAVALVENGLYPNCGDNCALNGFIYHPVMPKIRSTAFCGHEFLCSVAAVSGQL